MRNVFNKLFCFTHFFTATEKLLICENDPKLDLAGIQSLTTSKLVTEILNSSTLPKTADSLMHEHIHIAYGLVNKDNLHKKFRIFKIDRVSSFIGMNASILYLLEFTQDSFEELILCNNLMMEVKKASYCLMMHTISNNLNYDQTDQFLTDNIEPVETATMRKIKKHMTNKRKRYHC